MFRSLIDRFGAWPLVTMAALVGIGVLFLIPGLFATVSSSFGDPIEDLPYGRDLRAFMGAGDLAAQRDGASLYDPSAPEYAATDASDFVNPPWYAMAMIPVASIPFDLLWIVWCVVGIVVLWWTLARLDLARADRWVAGSLLSLAGVLTVFYGQNAFFMAAILALAVAALDRSAVTSGSLFALAAFKPHLLLGFVVWWLYDLSGRWRLILWASVATATLVGVSAVWMPDAWPAFFEALGDGELVVDAREVSLVSAVRLLVGDTGVALYSLVGLAIVGVISALLIGLRQSGGDTRIEAGLAVIACLLLTPRALAYDWVLLLVALALLVGTDVVDTRTLVAWAAGLGAILAVSFLLNDLQLDRWDRAISLAPLTLLVGFGLLIARVGTWSEARGMSAGTP